jgi:hypothetical protein
MEFLHASLALLASMVLVLAGMVGWLYWQQTRLFQTMNSIIMVIGELARPPPPPVEEAVDLNELVGLSEKVGETIAELKEAAAPTEEDDDRTSVEPEAPKAEVVEGPPAPLDTDGLESKSKKELQELLTKRGIPFGKGDTKSGLISLLKATA